jgi:hypothetical protein
MEITLFIDHVGFTIVGEKIKENENSIEVKNPAVLQSAPNQQGQLQVQLMPVLFREFLDSSVRNEGVVFTYPKNKIVLSNADLDTRLKAQYEQMFAPVPTQPQGDQEVIKLFDDEESK